MKPRLLIFHRVIAPYRIDFFNDLSKAFETRVCLQYKNLLNQKFDYDRIAAQFEFTPIYLKELFRLKSTVFSKGYWKLLNDFQPDMVLVSEFGLDCILTLLHKRIWHKRYKIVSICDDSYNMVADNNDFSTLHRKLRQWITPKLDELVLVEPQVTAWYQEKYRKGFCFPIIKDDLVARKEYYRLLSKSHATAQQFHLIGKRVFLFVGRLVALKNVETIIKAFSSLHDSEAVLVIIGDGTERERLVQIAKDIKEKVIFTGRLEGDALYQWYNIANVFVLASYQESFGAVTNEALLAGCKCLISCKAGSQCLIENGKNGYTFQPMDISELAARMRQTIGECLPVTFQTLRPSQMQFTYRTAISGLIQHLNNM